MLKIFTGMNRICSKWPGIRLGRYLIRVRRLDFRKFLIFRQLPSNQKYIYTWWIRNFLDVLKSYESESFISGVYDAQGQELPPPQGQT